MRSESNYIFIISSFEVIGLVYTMRVCFSVIALSILFGFIPSSVYAGAHNHHEDSQEKMIVEDNAILGLQNSELQNNEKNEGRKLILDQSSSSISQVRIGFHAKKFFRTVRILFHIKKTCMLTSNLVLVNTAPSIS